MYQVLIAHFVPAINVCWFNVMEVYNRACTWLCFRLFQT